MFLQIIILEWKSFFRAKHFGQSLTLKILMGFVGLMILSSLWTAGAALYDLLEEQSDSNLPIKTLNQYLLYWYLTEMTIRFMMQQLPILNSKPLLILPVRRTAISHYILTKSFFSYYNLLTPILFVPFAAACVKEQDFSWFGISAWLAGIILTSTAVHYLNFLIQQKLTQTWKWTVGVLIGVLAIAGLDYVNILPVSSCFGLLFDQLLQSPIWLLVPISFIIASYVALYQNLHKQLYIDKKSSAKRQQEVSLDNNLLSVFGKTAPFLQLDLRLIWRNKRSKSMLITSVIALFYGVIFYKDVNQPSLTMTIFASTFMSGAFAISFGQLIPAWDSAYYPIFHTQPFSFSNYLKAKYILLSISIILASILCLPYVYVSQIDVLWTNLATMLFNVGVNIPMMLYFGSFNKKRLELDQSQLFNYQGMGASQFFVALPALIVPTIFWFIFKTMFTPTIASIALGFVGIIGIAFNPWMIQSLSNRYLLRRHIMIEGFKQVSS
ncbi:DUF5687 family protein [Sphingobacterium corticis]|uniref:DUF5687 family protein n=1 Tax=Sphingobacterium corticis TaxID=1812823 RepID=A0ABW5NJR5_9SPHI